MAARGTLRLGEQLCFALYAATNAVTRAYRPLLAELDLTYPQYLVMMALWQEGSAPVGRIARSLQLGASAVIPLLDQLEAAALVARRRDARDRRVVHVELTQAGRVLEASAALAQQAVVCRTGLSEGELARLREDLHGLVNRMAATGGGAEANRPPTAGGVTPEDETSPA